MGKETTEIDEAVESILRNGRIRCPKCGWRPTRQDRWSCSCLHAWNTFETRGKCPACGKQWSDTQCPRCHQWSPHEAWYARGD
jgi:hypothetical protein